MTSRLSPHSKQRISERLPWLWLQTRCGKEEEGSIHAWARRLWHEMLRANQVAMPTIPGRRVKTTFAGVVWITQKKRGRGYSLVTAYLDSQTDIEMIGERIMRKERETCQKCHEAELIRYAGRYAEGHLVRYYRCEACGATEKRPERVTGQRVAFRAKEKLDAKRAAG